MDVEQCAALFTVFLHARGGQASLCAGLACRQLLRVAVVSCCVADIRDHTGSVVWRSQGPPQLYYSVANRSTSCIFDERTLS
jgi:hypothetical protein